MITQRFSSLGQFISYCRESKPAHNQKCASQRTDDSSWSGTANFSEALELATTGWLDMADKMANAEKPILDKLTAQIEQSSIVYDVEGVGIDVARYLDGEPECWQDWHRSIVEQQGTRHIRIVFNCVVSAGISATVIQAKGAAIASLIEALEFAGHRVQLDVAGQWGTGFAFYTTIKQFEQPLDMPHLAYALAHPSMLRRLVFKLMESQTCWRELAAYGSEGYGGEGSNWRWTTQCAEQGDLYIGHSYYMDYQWTNAASTEKWIKEQLAKQGIVLNSK